MICHRPEKQNNKGGKLCFKHRPVRRNNFSHLKTCQRIMLYPFLTPLVVVCNTLARSGEHEKGDVLANQEHIDGAKVEFVKVGKSGQAVKGRMHACIELQWTCQLPSSANPKL